MTALPGSGRLPTLPTPAAYRRRRLAAGLTVLTVVAAIVLVAGGLGGSSRHPAPTKARTAAPAAATHVYGAAGTGGLSPAVASDPYRLYVPESAGTGIDVIDPATSQVVAHYPTGLDPQHVVPAWDLRTLYATNDLANSLTPIDPATAKPSGPNIPVDDPYNLYFTPDGQRAIVVAEARQRLDFYDLPGFKLHRRLSVDCKGVDHADFSPDGSYLIASCEFAGRLVKVDLRTETIVGYLDLAGSSPQDVRLDDTGTTFYVADMKLGGVHLIDAASFREVGFMPTGRDAHGIYPSRDGASMYVSNRGSGTVSVIDVASRRVAATWTIPGGGSPDMGGVSPDGRVLWLSGRYNAEVYGFSTADGQLMARIQVPNKPHGMCVWPQPGQFSLGHTGNMR
ncbi:MAG: hypothetical protein ABR511_06690 [Acidimicrobiales bacterium]